MTTYDTRETPILMLEAKTAADLMVPTIVSVRVSTTLQEAVAVLTERHISAVPVLDEKRQPVGVLSRSDIVAHDCHTYGYLQPGARCAESDHFISRSNETRPSRAVCAAEAKGVLVQDIMTPVVYSVARDTPAPTVVDALLSLNVHRLFVTDEEGEIVGVISTIDVLRHLQRPREYRASPSDQKEIICEAVNGSLW